MVYLPKLASTETLQKRVKRMMKKLWEMFRRRSSIIIGGALLLDNEEEHVEDCFLLLLRHMSLAF